MKPFLLLATRPEDVAADDEYAAFLRFSGLSESGLVRRRLEQKPLGPLDLSQWSGVLLGGSPFTSSDPEHEKSPVQRRVEADLRDLLDRVVPAGFPLLGACYGVGTLGWHQGAVIDRRFGEPVGAVTVSLTAQGRRDPVFGSLPPSFDAFVGHKEAVTRLPPHAVVLAGSDACPVQAFRIGEHAYATQFHPELDADGLATRVETYRYAGYFEPHEAERITALARAADVAHPPLLLKAFVGRYRTPD